MKVKNPAIVQRYARVVQLNRDGGRWNRQRKYRKAFPVLFFPLPDSEIEEMMEHRHWLGCCAPTDGLTDRLAFDIDSKTVEGLAMRDDRYWRLRALLGMERIPLVYQTPSSYGLRVVYRIPETPLIELVEDFKAGLVPDVLRAAGLPPEDGSIEVYPQVKRADRLPLGRRMPILDPESLLPVAGPRIGDEFDPDALDWALRLIEAWHARPISDLKDHLHRLPRMSADTIPKLTQGPVQSRPALAPVESSPSRDVSRLFDVGLTGPGQRRQAECDVGRHFIAHPTDYPHFGLSEFPTDREIAEAIARWLAERNNGHSSDWNRAVRQYGGVEEAKAVFVELYLTPHRLTGETFIDRLRRAPIVKDKSRRRVNELSSKERNRILEIAERHFPVGVARYRFECWLFGYLRSVKRIVTSHHKNRTLKTADLDPLSGKPRVLLQIHSRWMRNWPYGDGQDCAGAARYRQYVRILVEEGVLQKHQSHRARNISRTGKGTSTVFVLRCPDLTVRAADLDVDPRDLKVAIQGLMRRAGKEIDLSDAYHALHVQRHVSDLTRRYGRATAERIRHYCDYIDLRYQGVRARPE
jgi:hypothetical protein